MARICTSRPAHRRVCGWPAPFAPWTMSPVHPRGDAGHRRVDHAAVHPRDVPPAPRGRLRLQPRGHRPVPGQRLLPAGLGGPGHAPGPGPTPPPSRSWASPRSYPAGRGDAGPGAGDRTDRLGEDHHAGRHGRPHQPHPLVPHRHHRGPGGVPPHRRPGRHRPAGGRVRHRLLRVGHAGGPPSGPRRHPGGRDARPGDRVGRPHCRRDRPPGVLHAPHHQRHRDRSTGSSTSSRPTSSHRSGSAWPGR